MLCPSCQADNREGARFCRECGSALALRCATCGATHLEGQRFCDECGAALTPAAATEAPAAGPEIRVVSVLFADLVGFTSLSESRDPEDVRELLSRYFDVARTIVERYGGTIEKFIGDAIMTVWGAPVAREDDAERAVRAGLDLVDAVSAFGEEVGAPELKARAGVVTGQVASVASPGESLVVGDRVNTASRVQSVAQPGTVYVDDTTRQVTSAGISYEDTGDHAVKGKHEPLHLWRALRVIAGIAGAQRGEGVVEAPLVGRETELRLLKEQFHAAMDRPAARLLAISGPAGVGKTRMRWEFLKYLDGLSDTVLWHSGRCPSYGDGVAYWALAEMVRQRLRIADDATAGEAENKLAAGLERWVSDPGEREFLAPRIGALIGIGEATLSRPDLFAGWRLFFERLSDHLPLVMVFEDLQWADDGLLDFLEHLLDWSAERPIFILTLARPELSERRPGWPPARPGVTPLFLEPLAPDAVGALLDELVVGLPAPARERIVSQSEGIPLYALETVRALADRGVLAESDGRFAVAGDVGELEVPATLSSLLTARLDGLEPDERALVKDLAVMEGSFPRATVSAISDLPDDRVDALLASLVRKQVLVVRADTLSPDSGQYAFSQTLLRNVAYDMLSRHERKARHLAIAGHLRSAFPNDGEEVSEVIAAHYLDAYEAAREDPDADELRIQALDTLRRAARRAEMVGAPEASERALRTAVELTDDDEEKIRLTEQAGDMALLAARYEESIELFNSACTTLEAAGRDRDAARLAAPIGKALGYLGRNDEAVELMEGALVLLGQDEMDPAVAELNAELASVLTFAGQIDKAAGPLERALRSSSALGRKDLLCEAFINRGIYCALTGRMEEGIVLFEGAMKVAERHGFTRLRVRAELNAADQSLRGGMADMVERSLAALEQSRRLGDRGQEAVATGNVMLAWLLAGNWDEVEQIGRDHLGGSSPLPDLEFIQNRMVSLYVPRGQIDAARKAQDDTRAWASTLTFESRMLQQATEGMVLLGEGRPAEAFDVLADMIRAAVQVEGAASEGLRMGWAESIDAGIQAGKLDETAALVETIEAQPPGHVGPYLSAQLARARGLLAAARGEREEVEQPLTEAIERFRALAYPYWLARTQSDLAAWLIDTGRTSEAAPLLDEAIGVFESLRAAPALARAVELRTAAQASDYPPAGGKREPDRAGLQG
ncbi:MAG TPA: adenylate/guanylate cyclase domain-containing protein [Thermoleophilaceae bacterium]